MLESLLESLSAGDIIQIVTLVGALAFFYGALVQRVKTQERKTADLLSSQEAASQARREESKADDKRLREEVRTETRQVESVLGALTDRMERMDRHGGQASSAKIEANRVQLESLDRRVRIMESRQDVIVGMQSDIKWIKECLMARWDVPREATD